MKERVVVGMSGGVDSSVVAALLQKQGYNVVGATLHLYDSSTSIGNGKTCCSITDVHDAKRIAAQLRIPHYILDRSVDFRNNVINPFVNDYLSGITPVPCATCNRKVKMKHLVDFARSINAKYIATGHYASIKHLSGKTEIHCSSDLNKDQTYFLSRVPIEELRYLLCPLGGRQKVDVRKMAQEMSLSISNKPDSQDICFVPKGDYVEVINKFAKVKHSSGKIMHIKTNKVLGEHNGLLQYTIGQRKGIRIANPNPLYVCKIDHKNQVLYVGEEQFLYKNAFIMKDFNCLDLEFFNKNQENLKVCIRALQPKINARITLSEHINRQTIDNKNPINGYVELSSQGRAITIGQICAVYCNSRLLGGGVISSVIEDGTN